MSITIRQGDCRKVLEILADETVHCVVTSPPYWGLRDYGVDGQLGLERSLGEHVETMVCVFREVRRVLRKDGTLWLNYGDSYATSPNGRSAQEVKELGADDRTFRDKPFSTIGPISRGFRPGLSEQGLSSWSTREQPRPRVGQSGNKGNAASDLPIRIRAGNTDKNGGQSNRDGLAGFNAGYLKPKDLCGIPWRVALALQGDGWWLRQDIIWSKPNPMPESVTDRCTKAHEYIFLLSKSPKYFYDADAIAEPYARLWDESNGGNLKVGGKRPVGHDIDHKHGGGYPMPKESGRNKRSVWEVATAPFSEAHFATFPPALIEPCILAGCPKGGTVLDPFGGAGTTGLVADRLGRNAILIELNPEYVAMAQRRIKNDAGMFAEINAGVAQ